LKKGYGYGEEVPIHWTVKLELVRDAGATKPNGSQNILEKKTPRI
jgi:hypothetical protein